MSLAKADVLAAVQSATLNALPAKAGSHVPQIAKGDSITITIPHGKKPDDEHWIQHIFVADCSDDTVYKILFHRQVAFDESDKPSLVIPTADFINAKADAAGVLRAFEYCTKVLICQTF